MSNDLEERLGAERPLPPTSFRTTLRQRLVAARPGRHRPERLWAMVLISAVVGLALLALAAALAA